MKIISLLLLLSGCTVVPVYKVQKTEFCERMPYDTICEGYDEPIPPNQRRP